MDALLLSLYTVIDYFRRGFDWVATMPLEQFVRVFWAVLFLEVPRYLITNIYVFFRHLREEREARLLNLPDPVPLVSVIVPALNEEETIAYTVRSLLEQDYPRIEIIIVDDGSTDRTAAVCKSLGQRGSIRYYRMQERQGKSAALNLGLSAARGEYAVFMDSDSTLDRDCISRLMTQFAEPRVGAVSGNLDVRNYGDNLLTWMQAMEYLITLGVGRRFKASVGILAIVPGAIGAFRRDLLQRIGLFEPGPGNDSDVTIRTRKLGRQIAFAYDAICRTNVPTRWGGWFRQRMRWDRNIIRNRLRKHRDIFNPYQENFEPTSFVSFVDTFLFVAILPLVWLAYFIDMLINFPGDILFVLFTVFVIHLCLNVIRLSIAIYVTRHEYNPYALYVCLPAYAAYRLALKLVRILAIFQELLLRSSYRDPFAPEKVRREMEVY
ncbi:MAG: glycosyltransferase family 2 protein [Chromatiales bacterium]